MKRNIKQLIFCSSQLLTVALLLMAIQGCDKAKEMDWVDLRYRVEDGYSIDAKQPQPFSFAVKSTDRWEVFGKEDWYSISPSEGEAGESYTVTVTCEENTNLDDRTDTIYIKSNYWIGKKFTLTQKGTAFLNVEGVDIIDKDGGAEAFDILSNQHWTAAVTEGEIWLSIETGASGEQNGQVVLQASPNTGEQRTGVVTIYDRHGVVAQEVAFMQDGVLLDAKAPENGKWFVLYEEAQQLVIPIEANSEWAVSKENPIDDDWYTFAQTDFDGSGNLVINVSEHLGSSVRTGTILLTTKATAGATPLVKTIRFKQANPRRPEVFNVNRVVSGNYSGPGGLMPGLYNFYVEPLGETQLSLFMIWHEGTGNTVELRYHILNKKTTLSTRPWCSDVYPAHPNTTRDVNTNQANVLSLDIREVQDKNDPSNSWIYSEWLLNGTVVAKATSDGISDGNGTSDTWKVPFSDTQAGANFLIQATGGSATVTKYEYVAPIVWGD